MFILFELAVWLFWWTIYHAYQTALTIFFTLLPISLLKKEMVQQFESVGIKFTFDPKQAGKYDKDKFDCEVVVHNDGYFRRSAVEDSLGMGECYMDGWFDCDDISEYFKHLARMPNRYTQILFDKVAMSWNQQKFGKLSKRVAQEHYDLGNDLYKVVLDKTMNYTCALWYPETKTLEEAQINKMDIVGRKLKLKPGMKVLDIGCGFGGAAKYLAQKFGVSVTCYNISEEQVAYARENCKGLDVEVILDDYRNATGQYDAVYSIGIFEHVGHRNYREYFQVVERCLKPNGLTLVHAITIADHQTQTEAWLTKYIFPGGELPHVKDYAIANKNLLVVEDVQSFAKSYAKTLRCWRENFRKNWDSIEKNYKGKYGGRFYRMFDYYLAFCEGLFKERSGQLFQVVYSKYVREEEYYSVRDHRE